MHGTRNGLKPVASGTCSFAYWLFLAITFQRKVFSKIHAVKNEGKPKRVPHVPWVDRRNERCPRLSNRQTDKQTNRQTDVRQDKYRNPPAHARRGLTIQHYLLLCLLLFTHTHYFTIILVFTVKNDNILGQMQLTEMNNTLHKLFLL